MSTHPEDEEGGAIAGEPGERRPSDPSGARPSYRAGVPRPEAQLPSPADRAERHRNATARAEQRRSADAVIAVVWDADLRRPSSFLWRRRTFRVERVVRTWVLRSGWWSEETEVSRHYWRVRAEGRLFDLSFDRITKVWRLEHVLN
jgi:hypothetical protein